MKSIKGQKYELYNQNITLGTKEM